MVLQATNKQVVSIFDDSEIYTKYRVEATFVDMVMGGIPQKPEMIEGWLRQRVTSGDEDIKAQIIQTLQDLGHDVDFGTTMEELREATKLVAKEQHGNTFYRDKQGLYLSSYQIKAAIKESTNILFAGDRWGRALALDTEIPTPSGWTTMGELRVGDEILGANGQPCRVTFATEVQINRPCFRLSFSDGTSMIADADHQWFAYNFQNRKHNTAGSVVTTLDMFQKVNVGKHTNWSVDVAGAVDLPERDLPIDPYTLGAWLGDGSAANASICMPDHKLPILGEIERAGYAVRLQKPRPDREPMYGIGVKESSFDNATGQLTSNGSLYTTMRESNLIKNKHVPSEYLRASISQRIALLQGMMDTDGSVEENGRCEFTATRLNLSQAVFEIAASMGWKPVMDAREYDPPRHTSYRVRFYPDRQVFRLDYKVERLEQAILRPRSTRPTFQRHRFVRSIERVESVPVRCIQVDSPDHLFLASRAFIPTHNTKKGPKSFVAERVFVDEQRIYLGCKEPDGTHLQVGHVSGPRGERSTLTYYDYCLQPSIAFTVSSLNDEVEFEQWKKILMSMEKNGLGACRSLGHGQFKVTKFDKL